jgi:gamma-glutamyltranspeptidase/glutathione hydrolase
VSDPQAELFSFAWPEGGPHVTTRPEITGTFGVVTSTHWLASMAGMAMLEAGGNAFDAAVAAGFVLQVVHPHLNGLGGEVPILLATPGGPARVICGQGTAPAAATPDRFATMSLDVIPGSGLLPAVVPGAFDAWLLLLRDYGTLPLERVLSPAIGYAQSGFPIHADSCGIIRSVERLFRSEWPSSAALWLPGGDVPRPNTLVRNRALAETYRRLLAEAAGSGGREAQIDRARGAFYTGFVAETIERFARLPVLDVSGGRHAGLITAADLAAWSARYEAPVTHDYRGLTVCKCGPWTQGPVLLQLLALLEGFDIASLDPVGPEFVHLWVEAMKLCFADREAFYGDPDFTDVPLAALLSPGYTDARRSLITEEASFALRPGAPASTTLSIPGRVAPDQPVRPPMPAPGDTCHVDVIDRHGNMVSATPSGGWLQSSPTIPELGFALGTRGQMFWLEPGLANTLAPGKRPRTTLSPSLVLRDGAPLMAFGTPGGDRQEQWSSVMFLRHVDHGMNLQEAIDAPVFHTDHYPSSFYPRTMRIGSVTLESRFPEATVEALRRRGHLVTLDPPWSLSQVCAARRDGPLLRAAATSRLMQAYAVGR